MRAPVWIEPADVIAFHDEMLARFGGLPGLRDAGLLESALGRPQQLFACGNPDLFDMAAAYPSGIARNHPFLDGNKRAAFISAALFLEINGERVDAPEEEVVIKTLALAAGELNEAGYAAWLRASCKRRTRSKRAR